MSFPAITRQKGLAFSITLVLLAGLSCDRVTAPPTTGGIDVALSSQAALVLDGIRVTVSGPIAKSMTFGGGPASGAAMSVLMPELPPGMYSVSVAGLVGGRVAHFGETSGIVVAVGNNSSANVALSGFQPIVSTVADTVEVLHFNVSYSAVPHATSYMVEWSKSPTMSDASSAVVTGTSAEITVAEEGQYYFAVRAANDVVTVEGLPSPAHPIYVMQIVSSVTVLPLSPSIVDGTTQQFTATARDQDNAIITNPTLFWASSNHLAATVNQNGLVTSVGPGQTTITAIAKGTPGSATLTVTSQAASKLVFTAPPTNTVAGQTITAIKVAIQNPKGEVATADDATQVTLAIAANPGSGALSGTAVATVVDGVATFGNLNINKSGVGYTLQATSGALTNATSPGFNITPGAANSLGLTTSPPAALTAGQVISPAIQIEIRDGLGNRVTTARDAVTLEFVANPGMATLSGATTVNAIDGVASFSGISVDKAAVGYTIRATAAGLTPTPNAGFDVTAAAAAALSFSLQPAPTSTDGTVGAEVTVRDAFGNLVTSPVQVALAIATNPGGGTLTGPATVGTSGGLAAFAGLAIDKVGMGYTLVASSGALPTATSGAFDVTVGAPAKLAFVVEPSDAEPGGPIPEVQVAILDAHDNQTSVNQDIDITLNVNPTGANFTGTTTVMSNNGVAIFSDLSIDLTGPTYQLGASTAGIAGVHISNSFAIALDFVQMSAGDINACALTVNGNAYCWGFRGVGGVGDGLFTPDATSPVRVVGGHTFSQISTGWAHACGIRVNDATAYCWGYNNFGQLGDGAAPTSTPTPVAVLGGHTFVDISAGSQHTCALDEDGLAWCWGEQVLGRLGNNNIGNGTQATPVQVFGSQFFSSISAGNEHTCAIQTSDQAAYCWGRQGNGRLGNNSNVDVGIGTPQLVQVPVGFTFLSVSAGVHTCGIVGPETDRRGYCWGSNANGQLGVATGDFADKLVPTIVANSLRFANLTAGYQHTCGATVGGSGFCWGLADQGRLGNGETTGNRETPRLILGGLTFTRVDAVTAGDSFGGNRSCGMTTNGLYCWGFGDIGLLGDGSTGGSNQVSTPVRVRGQR